MPQSLTNIIVHATFSTKDRKQVLTADHRPEVFAYLAGALKQQGCPVVIVGGHADHIPALFRLGRTVCIADVIGEVKASSSKWLKTKSPALREFTWQSGYAGFSVSQRDVDSLLKYIERQEEHHRALSYQDEVLSLLRENLVAYDERYLWDYSRPTAFAVESRPVRPGMAGR